VLGVLRCGWRPRESRGANRVGRLVSQVEALAKSFASHGCYVRHGTE